MKNFIIAFSIVFLAVLLWGVCYSRRRTVEIVKNMTFGEIWADIAGRVSVAFGCGAILERLIPNIINRLAIPMLMVGMVLSLVAAKATFQKAPRQ